MGKTVKGLEETLKAISKFGEKVEKNVKSIAFDTARGIEENAKRNAPNHLGDLSQSIATAQNIEDARKGHVAYKVLANATGLAPYAAFVEFGTGPKVSVPAELADVAAQFKGKKIGSFDKGLEAIKAWCKSKGIPEEAAYPILMSIIKNGGRPQPYLYPAFLQGRKDYLEDLKALLEQLSKEV